MMNNLTLLTVRPKSTLSSVLVVRTSISNELCPQIMKLTKHTTVMQTDNFRNLLFLDKSLFYVPYSNSQNFYTILFETRTRLFSNNTLRTGENFSILTIQLVAPGHVDSVHSCVSLINAPIYLRYTHILP